MPLIKANRIFVVAFVATAVLLPKQSDAQNESTVRRPMGSVIFVRHGESEWNTLHMHTGWYNTALTKTGKRQAKAAGEYLNAMRIRFDFVHTSLLSRAIQTTEIILREMPGRFNGTINTNWLLNERHCGAITGLSKSESNWIGNWTNRPPPMLSTHPYYDRIQKDQRYENIDAELPDTESVADAQQRFILYWQTTIAPQVQAGGCILVVAHQNIFRGAVKFLDRLSDVEAISLKIANSVPFVYEFDENLNPLNKFVYL